MSEREEVVRYLAFMVILVWAVMTLSVWVSGFVYCHARPCSLAELLSAQYEWVARLRVF